MSAIDRLTAHWKATKGTKGHATGFGDVEIHWSPWTVGEQDAVFGPFTDARGNMIPRPALYVRCLLVKAEDPNGVRLFADADEHELLTEADPREILRVANLIIADLNRTAAAAQDPNAPKAPGPTRVG